MSHTPNVNLVKLMRMISNTYCPAHATSAIGHMQQPNRGHTGSMGKQFLAAPLVIIRSSAEIGLVQVPRHCVVQGMDPNAVNTKMPQKLRVLSYYQGD